MAIYKSPQNEPMWDTWLFQDGETYHLFFLSGGKIGRARSRDLINWEHIPQVSNNAHEGDWDERGMYITGFTVKHAGKYFMSYGPGVGKPIGILISEDLIKWERFFVHPVLPSQSPYSSNAWRDLCSYYDPIEKVWHGYICADQSQIPCIAHVTSTDYINWEYKEPVFKSNDFVDLEVPEYHMIGNKHYILFSSIRSRKNTSGRKDAGGTWYLVSENRNGPYYLPQNPLLLGSGRGRYDSYVGRIINYHGQFLLYHQTWGEGPVVWGFPKVVRQIDNEALQLYYWEDLDSLKEQMIYQAESLRCNASEAALQMLTPGLQEDDIMITFTVDFGSAGELGVVWRYSTQQNGKDENKVGLKEKKIESGIGLFMNKTTSLISLENVNRILSFNADTINRCLRDDYSGIDIKNGPLNVRIIVRAHISEVYINDQCVFSMDVSDAPKQGNIGFLINSGSAIINNLCVTKLKPLIATEY